MMYAVYASMVLRTTRTRLCTAMVVTSRSIKVLVVVDKLGINLTSYQNVMGSL